MLRNIIKSPNDPRLYKAISLPNQIDCLLVSDAHADKSAASLNVKVGQIHDPIERQGLAHFLEHMLFLGTKKYPNQNDYSSYITSNSGSNNAYTALCNTNYFFDCSNNALEGGLDRFAQFFIHPLFTESCTEREINAVHSEHEKNLMSDLWRKMQLFRNSAIENHPYNKFGSGNKETLHHPSIRDDLLKFYNQYYSSNLMKLVIYGKEDLSTLEKYAQEMFSAVPNFNTKHSQIIEPAFTRNNLGNFWKIAPIKDKDVLEFAWILENLEPHYRNNPASYISHLVGHEGPNSLLSYLIDQGFATELSSGYSTELNLFTKFSINVQLTKKGLANHQEVCRIVFEYLKMLREKGPDRRIFDEIHKICKVNFEHKDKESPMNYVMSLSDRMHYYPLEDILHLNYLMEEYKPDIFHGVINSLTADNMRVYLTSKSVEKECDQVERWYGTKYKCEPFTQEFKQMFANPGHSFSHSGKRLDLPPINTFIPENFQIYTSNFTNLPRYPQKVYQTEKMDVYYKQDNTFKTPKASMYVKLYSNDLGLGTEVKPYMLLDLWVNTFNESLREMLYLASAASLSVNVMMDPSGPEIVISGFNDSIDKISVALFEKIRDFNPLSMKEQFVHLREQHLKDLRNFYKNQPYQQAYTFTSCMLKKGGGNFLVEEEIDCLENTTFEDLVHFHENFFKTTRLEGLFIGNMTQEQVVHVSENIEKIVSTMRGEGNVLLREDIPEVRVVNLKSNTTWFFEHVSKNSEVQHVEPNSSLMSVFQFEEETPFLRVLMSILGNYLKEPCFDKLRTDEQLGYIVSGFNGEMRKVLNYVVIVQSNIQGPQYLSSRVLNFLDAMREKIKTLTDEEFSKYVESIRVKILTKDLSIRQEGSRYWNEILTHKYVFDRKEKDLEQLNLIKKEDLVWLFEEMFYRNRKLFETHMVSQNHAEENQKLKVARLQEKNTLEALSPAWFKRRMPLHPDFASML